MSKAKKQLQIRQSGGDPLAREGKGYYVDEIQVAIVREWMVGPFNTEKEAREAAKDLASSVNQTSNSTELTVSRDMVRGSLAEMRKRRA